MNILHSIVPLFDWLPAYRKEWLRGDVKAGLTTSAVVYAAIAGPPLVIYAVLGPARVLSG
jgi:MFS superfamily sulfate permease-like transporter